ncbi:hypothetical protein Lfu02_78860 [Longispora fulva]|uniref:Secreted protein n=1 Tax=Longispora fulva TaxID=619741 RepID=A0A8J7G5F7_9ACTN|nr:hypothetical protein [Longispora fulva]MBG6134013.1 hypothetical protein [Longispora fulva]GIG63514.1 hypothetical protein Lfu02_78860 [Longispora fulva]
MSVRPLTRGAVVAVAAAATLGLLSVPAHADERVCLDAYQVGSTGAVYLDGQRAASVKQYWSPRCKVNYSYLYVWQSYRDSHPGNWTVAVYGIQNGTVAGYKYYPNTHQADFWSQPYGGAGVCTAAEGYFEYALHTNSGRTDERCG